MEEYIRVNVVPAILKHYENCIDDYKLTKCEIIPLENMVDNWSSFLYTLDLSAVVEKDEDCQDRQYSLFVKCMMDNYTIHSYEVTKKKFSNEIHIYNIVQPIFEKLMCQTNVKLFVEAPYAMMKDIQLKICAKPPDGIVVLENLAKQGYKLSPEKYLDMEHCVLALEQLGRWHALSLLAKELNPEQFHGEIIAGLKKSNWIQEDEVRNQLVCYPFIERLSQNVKYVKHSETFLALKKIDEKCQNISQYMNEILESSKQSKLSVLSHGDYCRNNILFRYAETGVPISAIPIDYQNVCYGSPALDISTLIYTNTKHEIRDICFMALLDKYHASLVTSMKEFLINETKKTSEEISAILPSFESIVEDYKQHGSYGVIVAIYFVPILIASKNEVTDLISAMDNLKNNKFHDCVMKIGGEVATKTVIDIFDTAISLNQIVIE